MKFSVAHAAGSASFWQELESDDEALTAEAAIKQSKLLKDFPSLDLKKLKIGIYGKACKSSQLIQEGDRVEVYLPTIVQEIDDDDEDDD